MQKHSGWGADMARSRFKVGTPGASIELSNTNILLERAINNSTAALRGPLEGAIRDIYQNVKREWPRPTKANRGGNRRKRKEGFNPPGWASTGFSHRNFRWATYLQPGRDRLGITVALTNPAQQHPRKGRYMYMARYPYPSRKFYWRELINKPMLKRAKTLTKDLTAAERRVLEGR